MDDKKQHPCSLLSLTHTFGFQLHYSPHSLHLLPSNEIIYLLGNDICINHPSQGTRSLNLHATKPISCFCLEGNSLVMGEPSGRSPVVRVAK